MLSWEMSEHLAAIFPKGIWVRNIKTNRVGMVIGHKDIDDLTSQPIIQYENGWVMGADKKDLVKGHYEKKWVDDEKNSHTK